MSAKPQKAKPSLPGARRSDAEDSLGSHGAELEHGARDQIAGVPIRAIEVETMAEFAVEIEQDFIGQLGAPADGLRGSDQLMELVLDGLAAGRRSDHADFRLDGEHAVAAAASLQDAAVTAAQIKSSGVWQIGVGRSHRRRI